MQKRDRIQDGQYDQVEPAGKRQPTPDAKQHVIPEPAAERESHEHQNRDGGEERRKRVDRKVVGVLNRDHAECQQCSERNAATGEQERDAPRNEDGAQIEQGGEGPADQVDVIVVGGTRGGRGRTDKKQRQRAVGEVRVADVCRIQR